MGRLGAIWVSRTPPHAHARPRYGTGAGRAACACRLAALRACGGIDPFAEAALDVQIIERQDNIGLFGMDCLPFPKDSLWKFDLNKSNCQNVRCLSA